MADKSGAIFVVMPRQNAMQTKPLSIAERKALVAKVAKTATGKALKGMALIDFREPTARERAYAETLAPRARQKLARRRQAA